MTIHTIGHIWECPKGKLTRKKVTDFNQELGYPERCHNHCFISIVLG
jgi:hypothetical protein